MSGFGPQIAPATTFPNFDQGLGRATKGLDNLDREKTSLGVLGPVPMFTVASIGAGVANTTIQARFLLPGRTKIPKIVVYLTAISDLTGCSFNIVLGEAASGVYTAGNVPGNDNSSVPNVSYNSGGQATGSSPTYAAGGGGIATNPATAGQAMFAADVAFNATNFPGNVSAGVPALTTGGMGGVYGQQFVPASPDAVWPNQGVLTLRATTTASTGSITNLMIAAYMCSQPLNATFPASNFPIYATSEPTVDY